MRDGPALGVSQLIGSNPMELCIAAPIVQDWIIKLLMVRQGIVSFIH